MTSAPTGCKRIFTDQLSGAQADRPGLKEALAQLREADTLVVWKLDRLGRSVKGFLVEAQATVGARDISHFGGWRAYVQQIKATA